MSNLVWPEKASSTESIDRVKKAYTLTDLIPKKYKEFLDLL